MSLFQLIYTSRAVFRFTPKALTTMTNGCHRRNQAKGITGLLLFGGNRFIQIIEGEQRAVEDLYDRKIARDPRHTDCMVLAREACASRLFPDWRMGKLYLEDEQDAGDQAWDQLCRQIIEQNPATQIDKSLALSCLKVFMECFDDESQRDAMSAGRGRASKPAPAAGEPSQRSIQAEINAILSRTTAA